SGRSPVCSCQTPFVPLTAGPKGPALRNAPSRPGLFRPGVQLPRHILRLHPETLLAGGVTPEGRLAVAAIVLSIPGTALKAGAQLISIGTNDLIRVWPPGDRIPFGLRVSGLTGRLGQRSRQRSTTAPIEIDGRTE